MSKRGEITSRIGGYSEGGALYADDNNEKTDALFSKLSSIKKRGGAIIPASDGAMELAGWQMTATGLIPPSDLSENQYRDFGRALLRLDTSMQWLLGDFVNIGDNFQWGETYQRLADDSGYAIRTLHDYAYVCRSVDFSIRIENLSFGHHQVIAGMSQDEQAHWLGLAASEGLSIAKMRTAIKESQLPAPRSTPPVPSLQVGDVVKTRAGHVGTVESTDGLVKVRTGNYITNHAANTLEALETIHEDDTFVPQEKPPSQSFDYTHYDEQAKSWTEARNAFEAVRSVHMATVTGKVGSATRQKTQQQIRDLIAHLNYIIEQIEA